MTGRVAIVLSLLTAVAAVPVLSARQPAESAAVYAARLSTVPIDLAMAETIAGRGAATATLSGQTLTVTGTFAGLRSPATIVRLHRGPNRGLRGPVLGELRVSAATRGEISGTIELTDAQVEDLQQGRLYLQLHSEGAPEGNLWGWLLAK